MMTSVHRHVAVLVSASALWSAAASCAPGAKSNRAASAQAKAMLPKVVTRVKAGDRAQAFADFTARRPPFFDRGLYVVCVDARAVVVAHGGFPTYVGSESFFKDVNGRLLAPVIRDAAAQGDGALRYTIRDEETNNVVEHKIGFFVRIGDDVCGVVAPDQSDRNDRNDKK